MQYDLNGKVFRSVTNTRNGEVNGDTLFYYRQTGDRVTAYYEGGAIHYGQLLAKVLPNGQLDMRYHHINMQGDFMLGQCLSTPEYLPDGRLKFREVWQWLSGDGSHGESEIEEINHDQ